MDEQRTATVIGGSLMCEGCRLENAANAAQNQFGYELGFTWAEAAAQGVTIWVSDQGQPWTDNLTMLADGRIRQYTPA
jgi:hypothetical protein